MQAGQHRGNTDLFRGKVDSKRATFPASRALPITALLKGFSMTRALYTWPMSAIAAVAFSFISLADVASLPETQEQQTLFLASAATGIGFMNFSGSERVFCPPANFAIPAALVREHADRGLTGEHDPTTFVMVAILELLKEFPCS